MSIAIVAPGRDRSNWVRHFNHHDGSVKVEIWPDISDREEVTCVVVWNHPEGELAKFPNLRLICSMGAGVDHIFSDRQLPSNAVITKVVDDQLSRDMSNYVIQGVLNHQRRLRAHLRSRDQGQWMDGHFIPPRMAIGILGIGTLGQDLARKLEALEFDVYGYSRSKKNIKGIKTYHGKDELKVMLELVNVVVCMLPLTHETTGFLNSHLFSQFNKGTYLINVARGQHLVDEDLLKALDQGFVSGALLDVFHKEPLPENHPFWEREEIMITPHNASVTNPKSVAKQILINYRKIASGGPFDHVVNREAGY